MPGDTVSDLVPLAAAVALSPIPMVAVALILGGPRARTAGPAFALGWIAGLVAVSAVVVVLLAGRSAAETAVAWLMVAIGTAFVVVAVWQWQQRPRHGERPGIPGWLAMVDAASPRKATFLGAALSGANPKNQAMTLAASASIAHAQLAPAATVGLISIFVALGSVTIVGAVLLYLLDAARAAPPLARFKNRIIAHNAVIVTVVLLLAGAILLRDGLTAV